MPWSARGERLRVLKCYALCKFDAYTMQLVESVEK